MLSQQIRSGVGGDRSLLDSIDAVRNVRAVVLLLATFVTATLIAVLAGSLAQESVMLALPFAVLAAAVLFYGVNAVGMMMMDEANGYPSRPIRAAIMNAVATSHRLILVLLITAALYLLGVLAFTLLLLAERRNFRSRRRPPRNSTRSERTRRPSPPPHSVWLDRSRLFLWCRYPGVQPVASLSCPETLFAATANNSLPEVAHG